MPHDSSHGQAEATYHQCRNLSQKTTYHLCCKLSQKGKFCDAVQTPSLQLSNVLKKLARGPQPVPSASIKMSKFGDVAVAH